MFHFIRVQRDSEWLKPGKGLTKTNISRLLVAVLYRLDEKLADRRSHPWRLVFLINPCRIPGGNSAWVGEKRFKKKMRGIAKVAVTQR